MSSLGWKFWVAPFTLWALYSCWYCGYQSGYADGHETAWSLSRPFESQIDTTRIDETVNQHYPGSMPISALQSP